MNILVGGFVAESNAAVKKLCGIEDFMMKTGDDVITSLYVKDIFEEANVTVIPSLYADGRGGGIVCKDAFDTIAKSILDTVRAYKYEIDGMFLFLHGASHILNLDGGSGEHYIMHEIRKIVGKHLPVAMVTDPHGNSSKELVENCTIVRSFRESPHTDRADAHRVAAKLLLEVLTNRRDIHAVYTKVPIILGGERTVSKDQPMMKINALLNEIEQDPRILSCSYQIGYVRHDSDKAGASAIVVPNSRADMAYAQQQADRIAEFAFSIRREFHFHGNAQEPDVAVAQCLEFPESPVYMTDSGDNCTAGAAGCDTFTLRQILALNDYNNKKILFACIADQYAVKEILAKHQVGDEISFELGEELNEFSAKVKIEGKLIATGGLKHHYGETTIIGKCFTVSLKDKPIDIIVAEKAVSFAERSQYETANTDMDGYDLTIVKQGYLYPDLNARAKFSAMSLTDGSTNQRTERIKYRMIMRPIFPIDDI